MPTIPKFDPKQPYAKISGPAQARRGACFAQNGYTYDKHGRAIAVDIHPQPEPVPDAEPIISSAPYGLENWTWQAIRAELEKRGLTYDKDQDNVALLKAHWNDPEVEPEEVEEPKPKKAKAKAPEPDDDDDEGDPETV